MCVKDGDFVSVRFISVCVCKYFLTYGMTSFVALCIVLK